MQKTNYDSFFFLFFIHRQYYLCIRIHNTQRNVCWHSVLFITTTSKITGLCWKRISWRLTHFVLQKAIMIKLAFKHYFLHILQTSVVLHRWTVHASWQCRWIQCSREGHLHFVSFLSKGWQTPRDPFEWLLPVRY